MRDAWGWCCARARARAGARARARARAFVAMGIFGVVGRGAEHSKEMCVSRWVFGVELFAFGCCH